MGYQAVLWEQRNIVLQVLRLIHVSPNGVAPTERVFGVGCEGPRWLRGGRYARECRSLDAMARYVFPLLDAVFLRPLEKWGWIRASDGK